MHCGIGIHRFLPTTPGLAGWVFSTPFGQTLYVRLVLLGVRVCCDCECPLCLGWGGGEEERRRRRLFCAKRHKWFRHFYPFSLPGLLPHIGPFTPLAPDLPAIVPSTVHTGMPPY